MDSIAVSVYEPRRGPSSQHQKLRRGPCLPAQSLFVWDEAKCRRIMMPKYHDQTIDWFRVFWMVYFTFSVHAWPRVGRWWEKAVTPKPAEPSGAEQSGAEPSGQAPISYRPAPGPGAGANPLSIYGKLDSHETLNPRMCKFGLQCKNGQNGNGKRTP